MRRAAPINDRALLLKKPVERISPANSCWLAAAKSVIVGYFRTRPGVTSLTRLSVHCAERIVATSNCQALEWWSAQVAPGYIRSKIARIFCRRARRSAAFFGFATTCLGVGTPFGTD